MHFRGILALDIDGTLTHRLDWIDPKVVEALTRYAKEGWTIAFITGRAFSFVEKKILGFFPFPYLLGVQNGADILSMPEKKLLNRSYFSGDIVPQIDRAYEGHPGDFIIYSGLDLGDFCYFRPERFSKQELDYLKVLEELGGGPWKSSDFFFDSTQLFPQIKCFGKRAMIRSLFEELVLNEQIEICMLRDPIDPSLYLNLITSPKANKGAAIQFLRRACNADIVIAAGDDGNDLKMLREADVSIAIETAPEEVKESADLIAKRPRELGILPALEEAIRLANR
ncbi:MAG: putative phosphatase [Chlamydiae bacterium]|nr:putative phosphatase [Chlamydiota bacterium]